MRDETEEMDLLTGQRKSVTSKIVVVMADVWCTWIILIGLHFASEPYPLSGLPSRMGGYLLISQNCTIFYSDHKRSLLATNFFIPQKQFPNKQRQCLIDSTHINNNEPPYAHINHPIKNLEQDLR